MTYTQQITMVCLGTAGLIIALSMIIFVACCVVESFRGVWINVQGIKDNAQHVMGLLIGTVSKANMTKDQRGTRFYSTVAVTLAQQGIYQWFPYKVIVRKGK